MDQQIGRVLNALEKSGEADNTWIVFTADHGLAVGHRGLLGKQNMYDHSMRVPFLLMGPGVQAGRRIDTPIYLQDIMPTTLELAGIEKPDHVQFRSLLPLLRGEADGHYEAVYGAYIDLQRMIRAGDFKLILYPMIGQVRLFNLKDDPHEVCTSRARPSTGRLCRGSLHGCWICSRRPETNWTSKPRIRSCDRSL